MPASTDTTYNSLVYDGQAFPQTHPSRIAAIARLHALDPAPAPVNSCRILELGCANGENIIPMAYGLPDATLLGIDLSQRQIDNARRIAGEIGVANVMFRQANILDIDASWGQFDYIIAHGVYSWAPPEVAQKILAVCRDNLAPGGVGFISYNIYPGWYEKMNIREAMLFHSAQFTDPVQQIAQARAYLKFLADAALKKESSIAALYAKMKTALETQSDSHIYHDYLEPHNHPCHFHEFAAALAAHSLQYLADSDFGSALPRDLSQGAQGALQQISPDWIAREQHLDTLRGRMFRQSLVVRAADRAARSPALESMRGLFASALLWPMAGAPAGGAALHLDPDDPRLFSADPVDFFDIQSANGKLSQRFRANIADPQAKLAFMELAQRWPMPVGLDELAATVARRATGRVPAVLTATLSDGRRLAHALLQGAAADLVELHAALPRLVDVVSPRPEASAVARWQAMHPLAEGAGGRRDRPVLTNLRHGQSSNEIPWELLQFTDGTRSVSEIIQALARIRPNADLTPLVPAALQWLAKNALLVK